jgi:hypothetical protein
MSENETNAVNCQSCDRLIGKYIEHEGQVWIQIGNVELYSAHGICSCGAEYHFWSSEKQLEKLLYRLTGKSISATIKAG